jgi:hypothetical protein
VGVAAGHGQEAGTTSGRHGISISHEEWPGGTAARQPNKSLQDEQTLIW